MGKRAIYRCGDCAHEFESTEGGAEGFTLVRCERCDLIKKIRRGEWPSQFEVAHRFQRLFNGPIHVERINDDGTVDEDVLAKALADRPPPPKAKYANDEELEQARERFKCPDCGCQMRDDLKPMCPICRSRNVKEKQVTVWFD